MKRRTPIVVTLADVNVPFQSQVIDDSSLTMLSSDMTDLAAWTLTIAEHSVDLYYIHCIHACHDSQSLLQNGAKSLQLEVLL